MLKIYNLKDKQEYIKEVVKLEHNEWAENKEEDYDNRINRKIKRIYDNFDNPFFCKLILLDDDKLVGFISLLETDGEERQDLKPWYGTIFVKVEYRGKGYSKILNDAILKVAKDRKYDRVYLKSYLENYYEKFGAKYIEMLSNGEKLYYIDIK